MEGRCTLAGQLKDTGMYSLYTDIEMPLIYSLFHMEQEGVKVERAELKGIWGQA